MKQGTITISAIKEKIDLRASSKQDKIVSTKDLTYYPPPEDPSLWDNTRSSLGIRGDTSYLLTNLAERQIGDRIGIPPHYFRRMQLHAPELLADNINHWLADKPEQRMLRTVGGRCRAFLSNRYKPLDHDKLISVVLPELEASDHTIISSALTERRLYIKTISPQIKGDIKPGDSIQGGLCISNSEVGCGALRVDMLMYRMVCANGLIIPRPEYGAKRFHLGAIHAIPGDITPSANPDPDFWAGIRGTVQTALDRTSFDGLLERFRATTARKIGNPQRTVNKVAKRWSFTQAEQDIVLKYLLRGDADQYGLVNAITRTSQALDSYDRASRFERIGGELMDMPEDELLPLLDLTYRKN